MRSGVRAMVVGAALVALAGGQPAVRGQQQPAPLSVAAFGSSLGEWPARVETMLRTGTLAIARVQQDTMIVGRLHERLAQRYRGLPVYGGELIVQRQGAAVVSVSGQVYENVDLESVTPALAAADAASLATAAAGPGSVAGPVELGIRPVADGFVLVYRLTVRSSADIRRYDVSAVTGEIIDSRTEIKTQGVVGQGTGVLGDPKKISTQQGSGGFQAIDVLRPGVTVTFALSGTAARATSFANNLFVSNSEIASDSNNVWSDASAVDAHVYTGWTYDYFFERFGRRGMDDANFAVDVVVHPLSRSAVFQVPHLSGLLLNNASYIHPGLTIYGDGDGFSFNFLAGALDVVAHEWTHGVTDFTSRLEYVDESGALNESFSDIMGTGAEFFHLSGVSGPQQGPNFLIAEDVVPGVPGHLRSMQNPQSTGAPDHYSLRVHIGTSVDSGGVHTNSSIVNHAFFLAVAGGTNRVSGITVQGVGVQNMAQMERIFYRAFVFGLGPLSQFSNARAATLQAATDLFGAGSNLRAQLLAAWTAVGVP